MKEICRIKIGSCWEKGSYWFVSYVTVERKGKESASNYIKQTLSAFDDVNADYAARIVKKQTRMNRNLENYKCSWLVIVIINFPIPLASLSFSWRTSLGHLAYYG